MNVVSLLCLRDVANNVVRVNEHAEYCKVRLQHHLDPGDVIRCENTDATANEEPES